MPIHQSRQNGKSSAMASIQRKSGAAKSASNATQLPHNGQQLTAADMMSLQGTIGNRGVQRMISSLPEQGIGNRLPIQAKMSVGPVGDSYEQEADKVAGQVVQQLQKKPATDSIQRMEGSEEESEELQMKPATDSIQRMEGLEEESEELQMKPATDSIQRMEGSEEESEELQMKPATDSIQRMEGSEEESEELQMKPATDSIQRMEGSEEESEELQMKPATDSIQRMKGLEEESEELQMKPAAGGFDVTPSIEQRIQAKSGAGSQMDAKTRLGMEQAMGADFSKVSIHNDAESGKLNEAIGAQAFTKGNDVFFSNGKYDPSSAQGQELLAHELTHVVQQRGV
ncbi:DUF4157 domain-containing protein [Paenibacillus sp. LMG 31456]|uniref:DUF4157 domain-containing protein n=1 Tax=Paenibacillus foliorum TaxID=2654974 RepID=A0A972GSY6_9BACL|nr:DUF4157 domain-containing protein [Paenibacillus foliorum]NOU93618.1 DUF4157 domain-containing protein [Paenibacillus foliorum]